MRSATIALMMGLSLTACSTAPIDYSAQPDLVMYSKPVMIEAAKEVQSGQCPTLVEFAKDYKVMRDQVRVVKENTK